MITTVTGKNQITIPAELARELDISPGTKLDWTKGEAGVLDREDHSESRGTGKTPGGPGAKALARGQCSDPGLGRGPCP